MRRPGGKPKGRPTHVTTRLPDALRAELEIDEQKRPNGGTHQQRPLSRKELRKEQRQNKKQKRAGRSVPAPTPAPAASPADPLGRAHKASEATKSTEATKASKRQAAIPSTAQAQPSKKPKPPREPSAFELMLQERGLIAREGGVKRDALDDEIDMLERKLGVHKV